MSETMNEKINKENKEKEFLGLQQQSDETKNKIIKYFKPKKALIAEPNTMIRVSIKKMFLGMGMENNNITITDSPDDANKILQKQRPHYIFASADVKGKAGIEILKLHQKIFPNRSQAGAFLLGDVSKPLAHIEALENNLEGYITPPLTIATLEDVVIKSLHDKLVITNNSSRDLIEKAKELLANNSSSGQAIDILNDCILKDKNSFEAYYLLATISKSKNSPEDAINFFRLSLEHNPIHYNSLRYLIEMHLANKQYKEASILIERMEKNYPVNLHKISDMIKVAIALNQDAKISKYGDHLLEYSEADDITNKETVAVTMAMLGKILLKGFDKNKGIKILERAVRLSEGKKAILTNIMQTLINAGENLKAEEILNTIIDENKNDPNLKVLKLEIINSSLNEPYTVLTFALKLLGDNIKDPIVYKIAIERSLAANREKEKIQELIKDATALFPNDNSFSQYLKE
ncbi:MAG: hypothetical protein HQK49_03865 [Oligoflexia bacterium]|nr:hypothetical protein [Oligoflexia bacterium]